ncbi:redoxin domain-containing protein [Photobacterium japonica]|uniref:TlpA family protein disulfide reductase n=1 Tax=Photobacterium japonica TaxID=2910235 RepID=UPI003D0C5148
MAKGIVISFILLSLIFIINRPTTLPEETLSVHDTNASFKRSDYVGGGCITEKCLVIYLAPWCPTCQKITPTIISLVSDMEKEGVTVTVVVGKDQQDRITAYANKFPFPVLTDANGTFFTKAKLVGVPYFAVTNSKGNVLKDYFGGYMSVKSFREELEI